MLRTEGQGRGREEEKRTMREDGEGFSSKNTSWINKSNQWLCPHLKVLGRLKQNRLKLWNICQQGWANTVRIITEEMSAAVGPKRPLSDRLDEHSNCCFLEIKDPIAELWFLAEGRHVCVFVRSKLWKNTIRIFFCFVFIWIIRMRIGKYTILGNYFHFQHHASWINTWDVKTKWLKFSHSSFLKYENQSKN